MRGDVESGEQVCTQDSSLPVSQSWDVTHQGLRCNIHYKLYFDSYTNSQKKIQILGSI